MKFLAGLVLAVVCGAQAQFEILDGKTTASLRGIDAVSPQVAWASGSGGTVLLTTDGGANWKHCAVPPDGEKLDFRGVQGFDATTAIVMSSGKGDLSRLYKTGNGCETWKLVFTNPDADGFFDALRFQGKQFGVVVGDPVSGVIPIFESFDLGNSWVRWADNPGHKPAKARSGESLFAASNGALIVPGTEGALAFVTGGEGGSRLFNLHLHDAFDQGGHEAFSVEPLQFRRGASSGAFAVSIGGAIKNAPGLMVVGGDFAKPDQPSAAAFLPRRSGCCYGLAPQHRIDAATRPHGYRSAVAYDISTKTWITVGPNGSDVSKDDGKNWTLLKPSAQDAPDADKNWNAISLPLVVGSKGKIGKLKVGVFAR